MYGSSPRRALGDGVLLVGDAAGLAYGESGEGIRPAVESGLLAAETILAAHGHYELEHLSDYRDRLRRRFGAARAGAHLRTVLPARVKTWLGARLLATQWFVRQVVVDRWFLHAGVPALGLLQPFSSRASPPLHVR